MKSTTNNRFVAEVSVSLPHNISRVHRWLNVQHTGKETLPLDKRASKKHQDAAWRLHMCRRYKMEFEVDKKGNWTFVKIL